jgi:hypothetical protein
MKTLVDTSGVKLTDEETWVRECAALLAGEAFPASQDDLLAALLRRGAPGRVLQHVALLDQRRIYVDLRAVIEECRSAPCDTVRDRS